MKNTSIIAILLGSVCMQTAFSQSPPVPMQAVIYPNITAASRLDGAGYIDNRSQYTRQSSYHAFRAYGTGSWSVTMYWADTTPTNWVSYGSTAVVSNASPSSAIGYGLDPTTPAKPYHDFIKFVFTGSVTIQNYFGTKSAWWSPSVAGISYPLTINQGGTGSITTTGWADSLYFLSTLTGAAARTAQSKLSDIISVRDFGATCDGSTIDDSAINAAIAASVDVGTLYVPCTSAVKNILYTFNSSRHRLAIVFASGAYWSCKNSDGTTCVSLVSASVPQDVTIQAMVLRGGDGSSGDVGCSSTDYGTGLKVAGGSTFNLHLFNITVSGFCKSGSAGVWLDGAINSDWTGGDVGNADDIGIKVLNTTSMAITNVTTTGSATQNAFIQNAALTMTNFVSQSGRKACIHAEGMGSSTWSNLYLENCNISGTAGKYAFELNSPSNSYYSLNNVFLGTIIHTRAGPSSGFYFGAQTTGLTAGNTFINNSCSGPAACIVIDDGGTQNTFENATALTFIGSAAAKDVTILNTAISPFQIQPRSAASTGSTNCTAPAYAFAGYLTTGFQSNGTTTNWLCVGGTIVATMTTTGVTFPVDVAAATAHLSGTGTMQSLVTGNNGWSMGSGWNWYDGATSGDRMVLRDVVNTLQAIQVFPGPTGAGSVLFNGTSQAAKFNATYTFATLPTVNRNTGDMVYCTDCNIASPVTSGGTGAIAVWTSSQWNGH